MGTRISYEFKRSWYARAHRPAPHSLFPRVLSQTSGVGCLVVHPAPAGDSILLCLFPSRATLPRTGEEITEDIDKPPARGARIWHSPSISRATPTLQRTPESTPPVDGGVSVT